MESSGSYQPNATLGRSFTVNGKTEYICYHCRRTNKSVSINKESSASCVICLSEKAVILYTECRHAVYCLACFKIQHGFGNAAKARFPTTEEIKEILINIGRVCKFVAKMCVLVIMFMCACSLLIMLVSPNFFWDDVYSLALAEISRLAMCMYYARSLAICIRDDYKFRSCAKNFDTDSLITNITNAVRYTDITNTKDLEEMCNETVDKIEINTIENTVIQIPPHMCRSGRENCRGKFNSHIICESIAPNKSTFKMYGFECSRIDCEKRPLIVFRMDGCGEKLCISCVTKALPQYKLRSIICNYGCVVGIIVAHTVAVMCPELMENPSYILCYYACLSNASMAFLTFLQLSDYVMKF